MRYAPPAERTKGKKLPRKGTKTYTVVTMRLRGSSYRQIVECVGGSVNTAKGLFYNWEHSKKTSERKAQWQKKNRHVANKWRRNYYKAHPEKQAYRYYHAKCWKANVKPLPFNVWYNMEIAA